MTYSYPGVRPEPPVQASNGRRVEFRYDVQASAPPQPAPQPKLISGKPYERWSSKEIDDATLWALGPAFRAGLKPPPTPEYDGIPPVPGSACDVQHSHMGNAASDGRY